MKAEGRDVAAMGGLHIIGSERHEARRIDLQLRGAGGRQGDPGSSRFYLSLEDDLMRIFAGDWVKTILTRLGMKEGEAIISHMVSRRIEGAQKKVEEKNFEIRKSLLEDDFVMDEQRKRVYGYRQNILNGANCKQLILEMIRGQIDQHLDEFLDKDYGAETFAGWSGKQLAVEFDVRDFRGLDFENAQRIALDEAERMVEGQVLELIDENLPEEEEASEWNWEALAKGVNVRWKLSLRDRDLRQLGRENVGEHLIQLARAAVQKVDLGDGARYLEPDYSLRTTCGWAKFQFGIELDPAGVQTLEREAFKDLVRQRAEAAYGEREIGYPIMAALAHFTTRDPGGHKRYDREQLVAWSRDRFHIDLNLEDLKNKQRDEIRDLLLYHSRRFLEGYAPALEEALQWRGRIFPPEAPADQALREAGENGRLKELSDWLAANYRYPLPVESMVRLTEEMLERHLATAVEEKFRPEMRRMERALVLQLLDAAWKDHLLAMDHLHSGVGLRGYAQIDPKVEYKREGMRIFEQMWTSVGERVTDLVFKMEQARRALHRLDLVAGQSAPRRRRLGERHYRTAAGRHRGDRNRPQAAAHPQQANARGPQRPLPLRQRQKIQGVLHEEIGGNTMIDTTLQTNLSKKWSNFRRLYSGKLWSMRIR